MLDLRTPSGWFFLLVGGILVALGATGAGGRAALSDANVNLFAGLAMAAFGGFLLALARGAR